MNYIKLYYNLCEYCKSTDVYERIKRRNPLDERLKQENIYQEKHHIVPKHDGGDDSPKNIVKMLPEEHYLSHYIRFRAFEKREDFLAVRFIYNGLPRYIKDDLYFSINKKVSKWKNHIYFFKKEFTWHTENGIKNISNARRGKTVVIEKETRKMIGSVDNNHPKILSGEWVNHTYGTIYVVDKKTKMLKRILREDFNKENYELPKFKRDKENNFNYKHIDLLDIKEAVLEFVDENSMVMAKDVLTKIGVSSVWIKNHYGNFSNLIKLINNEFNLSVNYSPYQRTSKQKKQISQTLRNKND